MALDWRISFDAGAGFVSLPNVQAINITRGKRRLIDPYQVETCEITSRSPSTWTTTPKVGMPILAYVYGVYSPPNPTALYWTMFQGRISDVKIEYGVTANMDVVTISCEGLQADLGRAQLTNESFASQNVGTTYDEVISRLGLPITYGSIVTASINSVITNFNGNALEFVNALVYTEQGLLRSTAGDLYTLTQGSLDFVGRAATSQGAATPPEFSDGTVAPPFSNYVFSYDRLEFRSAAEDYYNEVTVQPAGLANQTAATGATPATTYVIDSYDVSTGQALQLANYVLNKFTDPDSAVRSISARVDTQVNINLLVTLLSQQWTDVTRIIFRGAVYNVTMQGWTITASPGDQTRVTLFTAAGDTDAYLKLNDPYYGLLDYNRLGF